MKGAHTLRFGGEVSRTKGRFDLGVFRDGRVEMVQDFPQFDLNRDGRVDDDDLLFAVTLRSGKPDQDLVLDDCSSTYLAGFVQDDWRVTPQLTLNVGLRWEMDTNVKNISGYGDINPIVQPFLQGDRGRDLDNFGPRLGFAWTNRAGSLQVHGGWGLYYDRVTLEIMSLERGLDGRALPIEVRAGNVFFLDPDTGSVPPFAPTFSDPFTGFILPGAGASGINIIDNTLENPTVQQYSLGTRFKVAGRRRPRARLRAQPGHALHHRAADRRGLQPRGGRARPRRQPRVERGDAVRRAPRHASRSAGAPASRCGPRTRSPARGTTRTTTRSPSARGPSTRTTWSGSTARPRTSSGTASSCRAPSSCPWTSASRGSGRSRPAVPMDILMPDGATRVPDPLPQRGRARDRDRLRAQRLHRGPERRGRRQRPAPAPRRRRTRGSATASTRSTCACRAASRVSSGFSLEAIVECFNVFNVTNILGVSKSNYSGFTNVLARDSSDPADPGYLRSSSFGHAADDGGRRLRLGRAAGVPDRPAGAVLSPGATSGLQRRISLPAAAALVVGGTVGVGIFLTPAGMARSLASPALVFLVWAFMGAAALCGALSFGELAARYPEAGGSLRLPARGLRARAWPSSTAGSACS